MTNAHSHKRVWNRREREEVWFLGRKKRKRRRRRRRRKRKNNLCNIREKEGWMSYFFKKNSFYDFGNKIDSEKKWAKDAGRRRRKLGFSAKFGEIQLDKRSFKNYVSLLYTVVFFWQEELLRNDTTVVVVATWEEGREHASLSIFREKKPGTRVDGRTGRCSIIRLLALNCDRRPNQTDATLYSSLFLPS